MLMSGLRLSNLSKETTYLLTYLLTVFFGLSKPAVFCFCGANVMSLL